METKETTGTSIEVGQELYCVRPSLRRGHKEDIESYTVATVGRKYFTVGESRSRFHLDTLKEDADHNYLAQLYRTEQEILDLRRREALSSELSCLFAGWRFYQNLSLDQMERIKAIVNEGQSQ